MYPLLYTSKCYPYARIRGCCICSDYNAGGSHIIFEERIINLNTNGLQSPLAYDLGLT